MLCQGECWEGMLRHNCHKQLAGSTFPPLILIGSRKLNWLAVRRMAIGVPPFLLALVHFLTTDKTLGDTEPFQSVEPVLVIGVTQIWIASFLCGLDLLTQYLDPFGPGETACFRETHGEGESLCLPRLVEDWTLLVVRQRW
jgi:hypothetical protein